MSTAETLTAAADKLDTLLAAATSGLWTAHPDGLVWAQRPGDPVSGSSDTADAEYIAAMNPVVGRALVALLRDVASCMTVAGATDPGLEPLARAILGEAAS